MDSETVPYKGKDLMLILVGFLLRSSNAVSEFWS